MTLKSFILTVAAMGCMAAAAQENKKFDFPFWNHNLPVEERVNDLISRLTPEEKVGMMMNRSVAVDRLGIFAGKYQIMYGNSSRDEDLQVLPLEVK